MGDRGADSTATPAEIERMAAITRDAIEVGALGFSTSRTMVHATPEGVPIPGTFAADEELLGIARGIQAAGGELMEV